MQIQTTIIFEFFVADADTAVQLRAGSIADPDDLKHNSDFIYRVHAKGVVLCERTCFCLLSAF